MKNIQWCDPERKKRGDLKSEAFLPLSDVSAIMEGIKSALLKEQRSSVFQSMRSFRASTSKARSIDETCCFSLISPSRSLDLQALSPFVRNE